MNNAKTGRMFFQCILAIFLMASGLHVMGQSPPTATTGAATGITRFEATVNGTVNANGESTTVAFEYGLDTSYGSTWPATPSPVTGSTATAVSATLYELQENTTYHYRVVATNASGTTYGADMTFTTLDAPPAVMTNAATGLGVDTATLNGTVNGGGYDTTVEFEWGTDTSYGNTVSGSTTPITAPLSSSTIAETAVLTGLSSNTTYHFRIKATNINGTSYGQDLSFTLTAVAPTAVTDAATAVGSETATLNGTVNANGTQTSVTFEYGLDTSYGRTVNAVPDSVGGAVDTAVSAVIDDVLPNTTYHYRIVATNSAGTTNGADMTFTTLPLPPTAVTDIATSVGTTGATLNGTVNANNDSTTVTFEYGLDTGYGTTVTADQSPLTGTGDTAVSKAITGLTTGITYHYRVVATNAGGTTYGADMTFTTGTTPPSATTDAATGVSTGGATLNGTVNANGDDTTVTFEYGTSTDYDRSVSATPGTVTGSSDTAVSVTVSLLVANTTYHYRVVATNAGGTTYGEDLTFTTGPGPDATTEDASSVGTTGATLNGTVNANNESTTVTFEYGLTSEYGTTVTADQSPVSGTADTAVNTTLSGLSPSTVYHYRVVGQNASGTTYGADMTFTTQQADPNAPTAVTSSPSPVGTTSATLRGTVDSKNQSTTVYFEYGTDTNYGTTVTAAESPIAYPYSVGVSAALTGLTSSTTYHYRVVAQNAFGTAYGEDMTFFTASVSAPTAITGAATSVTGSSATLNGTVNSNNYFNTIVTFEYGTTTSYGSTVTADQSPVTGASNVAVSKTITGLLPNTTYHYRVKAQGYGTTYGADMTFTTAGSPTAVTNAATAIGGTTATVNGTVNANNASTTVTFEYGLNTSYGKTVTAAQSPVTGSTDTAVSGNLTALIPNTTYHYRVVATNANAAAYGADMTFTTGGIAPTAATGSATAVTTTGATLNGTVNAKNDSTTVTFQYGLDTNYGNTVTAAQSPVTGNSDTAVSAVLTGLTGGNLYHYRVVAQNSTGTTYGADMTLFTDPLSPTAITQAASSVGNTSATLNGTVNANNNSTTVTFEWGPTSSYGRTVTAAQSPVTGNSNTAVSAGITGLSPDSTYHYRVVAQSSSGTTYGADMTFTTSNPVPTATTQAATNVNATSATLNGLVNANNASTIVTFQYGTDTNYGTTVTAAQSPVTGSADTAVSAAITGLAPNTTYHFRVAAQNSSGTAYGADITFTTSNPVPTATTQAATNVTTTGATLNGLVNANNYSTTVTFEYGTTTSYGTVVTAAQSPVTGSTSDTAVSANISGLAPNTTYHFRVVAQNSFGTGEGADKTFTTGATAPIVTTQAASNINGTSATLNGLVNANNASTTVTFEYGTTTAYGTIVTAAQSPVTGTGDTAVSADISGLVPNTTYHFRVVGQNSGGTSNGADLTFTTQTVLPDVTTAAASDIEPTSATLNGLVNANNDSTTVTFEYGIDTGYGNTVTAAQSPVTGTGDTAVSANVTGLVPDTLYHFRVVGQNSEGTAYGADLTFTTLPPQTPTVTTKPVTKVNHNSARSGGNVTDEGASPVTARGVCWSTSPNPTIADSITTDGSGPGEFTSKLKGLSEKTTYYVRAYATNSFGTAYGEEFEFTTDSKAVSVTIIKPKDGDVVSGTVTIHAVARSTCGHILGKGRKIVKVEFYIDGTKIAEDVKDPFKTGWDTISYPDGTYTVKAVAYNAYGDSSEDSIMVTVNNTSPSGGIVTANRDELIFNAIPLGKKGILFTLPQVLLLRASKGGVKWAITSNAGWLSAVPRAGKGSKLVLVFANPKSKSPGTYSAALTIKDPNNAYVYDTVNVQLEVLEKNTSTPPFGEIDTPFDSVTVNVNSDVPVSGWVLDDIEVTAVRIYREPLEHEGSELIYLGDAVLLDNARPAVEKKYRDFPLNYRAGWGYLLKTNALPGGSNSFTLVARAEDKEGHIVTLGKKTITIDFAAEVKPFGDIDIQAAEADVEGANANVMNMGWALTPRPYTIPGDGSGITVWVDGLPAGNPVYNQYNQEVAHRFPGYNNEKGAGGYFSLDAASLTTGIHTIAWWVEDNAGNNNAVGFRYFSVENSLIPGDANAIDIVFDNLEELEYMVPLGMEPRFVKKGFSPDGEAGILHRDEQGTGVVSIEELEPVELQLGNSSNIAAVSGYLVSGDRLGDLPAGSTLDIKTGRFSWLPGPGHFGEYLMVFVVEDREGGYTRTPVRITIEPKFKQMD